MNIQELQEENNILRKELAETKSKLKLAELQLADRQTKLFESHKELSDSISYAKRIQVAILPPEDMVKRIIPNSFVLYMPKDVVSGDFYFMQKYGDFSVFAAVDCTGHGVPGALMSVVGFNFLHQAVTENHLTTPSDILSFLDEGVNERLRQTGGQSGVNDGMDLGLCSLNYNTLELQYAGAYNPVYIVHNGILTEIKPDKFPIGVNTDGVADIYTNHKIQVEVGDCIYLLSDGYADQFGGSKNKKFKYKQLKELLTKNSECDMAFQKKELLRVFMEWQGDEDQIDDVLLIGVKIE